MQNAALAGLTGWQPNRSFKEQMLDPQPEDRMAEIEDNWRTNPGAAPGGTGPTGLLPGDARGWSDLLNQQTEHAALSGHPITAVKRGRDIGSPTPNLANDPHWWLNAMSQGPFEPTVQSMPYAMQGLFAAGKK